MPVKLHNKIKNSAIKAGLTGKKADAYIYSTLRKIEKVQKRKNKK